MNTPDYTIEKIKFATDGPTFEKAVTLYQTGKVTDVKEGIRSYTGTVLGTKPYHVFVEARRFDYGHCPCYLGENGTLCKHLVALAIFVVQDGKPLSKQDTIVSDIPVCSNELGALTEKELSEIKQSITSALRYIKPYAGPSRLWFSYQSSLSEGCRRLSSIISPLPVSIQTAHLLVDLLLRLDKKLSHGGVDDSEGTVGGFMKAVVDVLKKFAQLDIHCVGAFYTLKNKETCFGWEEPLVKLLKPE